MMFSRTILLACGLLCQTVVQSTVPPPAFVGTQQSCNESVNDIMFVLDSSGSMGQRNFTVMKEFVKSIINNLKVGMNDNHIGVITFSQYPTIRIPLTDYMDKQALLYAIDRIPYVSGITETHTAIQLLRLEGFMAGRPNVPHTAIVMTDGKSFHEYQTALESQKAQQEGITMFAVGIGTLINQQELEKIASDPDSTHVLTVADFNSLATITSQLSTRTCEVKSPTNVPTQATTTTSGPITTYPTGAPTEKCNQTVVDLMFILDSSSSVGFDNFNLLRRFVMDIVNGLDIGDQYTKVGVITFSDYPTIRIPLGKYNDRLSLINAISAIPYIPGNTETDKALDLLLREGYDGGRVSAPNIAIIITDGRSTHPDYTEISANDVKSANIYLLSVGIGQDVSRTELSQLASVPDPNHIYMVQNFTDLPGIVNRLSATTCTKAETITTLVPPTVYTTAVPTPQHHGGTPSPPTPGSGNTSCNGRAADIFFLLDASASVHIQDFDMAKNFIKTVINQLHVDSSNVRVGMIAFSTNAHLEFGLGDFTTTAQINAAVDNILHYHGGTNTAEALQMLIMTTAADRRAGVPVIGIVLTDGTSKDALATKVQAKLAKDAGITLIAIGIGQFYQIDELNNIASPDAIGNGSYVIEVDSFDLLYNISDLISYMACGFSVIMTGNVTPEPHTTPLYSTSGNCTDAISNCPAYGRDICFDYEPWAKAHCSYHCGFCQGPSTAPPPCVDTRSNCREYGTYICTDLNLVEWTKNNCRKYCGFCGNGTKPTEPATVPTTTESTVCQNTISNCHQYDAKLICSDQSYAAWSRAHCREFCGFCSNYVDFKGPKIGNITCPDWHLPVRCTISTVAGSCCPMPQCPDGYTLSAVPPNQIKH